MKCCKESESESKKIRCNKCGKLLMKGKIVNIEVKCPRCKCVQEIQA